MALFIWGNHEVSLFPLNAVVASGETLLSPVILPAPPRYTCNRGTRRSIRSPQTERVEKGREFESSCLFGAHRGVKSGRGGAESCLAVDQGTLHKL